MVSRRLLEVVHEIEQSLLQILQRFEVTASHHATNDDAKNDCDLVQPRRVFRKRHELDSVAAIRQELSPRFHRLQYTGVAFLSERTSFDPLQLSHVTDKCCAAMHVQIIEHNHPADKRAELAAEFLNSPIAAFERLEPHAFWCS